MVIYATMLRWLGGIFVHKSHIMIPAALFGCLNVYIEGYMLAIGASVSTNHRKMVDYRLHSQTGSQLFLFSAGIMRRGRRHYDEIYLRALRLHLQ